MIQVDNSNFSSQRRSKTPQRVTRQADTATRAKTPQKLHSNNKNTFDQSKKIDSNSKNFRDRSSSADPLKRKSSSRYMSVNSGKSVDKSAQYRNYSFSKKNSNSKLNSSSSSINSLSSKYLVSEKDHPKQSSSKNLSLNKDNEIFQDEFSLSDDFNFDPLSELEQEFKQFEVKKSETPGVDNIDVAPNSFRSTNVTTPHSSQVIISNTNNASAGESSEPFGIILEPEDDEINKEVESEHLGESLEQIISQNASTNKDPEQASRHIIANSPYSTNLGGYAATEDSGHLPFEDSKQFAEESKSDNCEVLTESHDSGVSKEEKVNSLLNQLELLTGKKLHFEDFTESLPSGSSVELQSSESKHARDFDPTKRNQHKSKQPTIHSPQMEETDGFSPAHTKVHSEITPKTHSSRSSHNNPREKPMNRSFTQNNQWVSPSITPTSKSNPAHSKQTNPRNESIQTPSSARSRAPKSSMPPAYEEADFTPISRKKFSSRVQPVNIEGMRHKLGRLTSILEAFRHRHEKVTTRQSAFDKWKGMTQLLNSVDFSVPVSIRNILMINNELLWKVFSLYVPDKLKIPQSPPFNRQLYEQFEKEAPVTEELIEEFNEMKAIISMKYRKKLLDIDGFWSLLKDLNVCPHLLGYIKLRDIVLQVIQGKPPITESESTRSSFDSTFSPQMSVSSSHSKFPKARPRASTPGSKRRISVSLKDSPLSDDPKPRSRSACRRSYSSPDGKIQFKLTMFSDQMISPIVKTKSNNLPTLDSVHKKRDYYSPRNNTTKFSFLSSYEDTPEADNRISPNLKTQRHSPDIHELKLSIDAEACESVDPPAILISFNSFLKVLWRLVFSYLKVKETRENIKIAKELITLLHKNVKGSTLGLEKMLPVMTYDAKIRQIAFK